MEIFKKGMPILIILLISGAVFFGYRHAATALGSYISDFSEEKFNAKVSIGCAGLGLPLCLELKDVEINESINIRSVRIYPNPLPFLLKNRIILSTVKIVEPVVRIKKGKGRKIAIPDFLKKEKDTAALKTPAPNFYFSKIYIQNGTLIYEKEKETALEFVGLKGVIERPGFYFSKNNGIRFAVAGFLKNRDSDFLSPLKINGYMESDDVMKARVQCSDIKINTSGPIYKKYLSGIVEKGRVDFKSDVRVTKTNMIAECSVEGEDVVLRKDVDQKIDTPLVANFIVLIGFRNKVVKVKNLQGNFLNLIFDR